ncbi:MAG: N utilization substance protein A [Parcubacteria group bacterium Gr01-1014_38]|nr:MAG: N utilization substance protein A [Parcubacteria group bacterium Gr01-1014_38]
MPDNNFSQAIAQIAEEKGIPPEKVVETIAAAIAAAYRRDYGKRAQDIRATFDPQTGRARIYKVMTVVEPPVAESGEPKLANPDAGFTVDEARKHKKDAAVGEEIFFEVTPSDPRYGRIAAQTAKQVIIQRIREAERQSVYDAFKGKEGAIVNGTIQRIEGGNVFVDLGRATGILFPSEQVPTEHYRLNQRLKVFVQKVEMTSRGTDIVLSRAHPGMLMKLFELEVPEIFAGVVEIIAIAREPGVRSKIAVVSHQDSVDPVGSCIGQRGTRIQTVISELSGEKIDVISWNQDHGRFIANALSPAKVVAVDLREDEHKAIVHVKEDQLSLAIGKRGQNVRLAAKLAGWRIDIVRTGETGKVEGTSEAAVPPEETEAHPDTPETPGAGEPRAPEAGKPEASESAGSPPPSAGEGNGKEALPSEAKS